MKGTINRELGFVKAAVTEFKGAPGSYGFTLFTRKGARAMELDVSLIVRLREMATAGRGVCEMVCWLLERLSLDGSTGRIKAIAYFQQAFFLSVGDAAAVGAWHIFPGGTWSNEECEQFLLTRIRVTRNQWALTHS